MMKEDTTKKQNTQPLRDSIQIMLDWIEPIRELPASDFQKIVLAIVDFACYGKSPELSKESPQTKMAWSFIAPQLKRMNDHYQEIAARNRVNGYKGGRPRKANDDSSEEEPPNPQNPSGLLENPKNPSGLLENPKNPIRKDKIREDNNKEKKSQDKKREGKESAPFDEEGAYSPSSLTKIFDFIDPSLSSSFSLWIRYLNRKDRDKLMPKNAEEYQREYECLVSLCKNKPDIAQQIVDKSIERGWARLYPLKKPPFSLSPIDIGHVDGE